MSGDIREFLREQQKVISGARRLCLEDDEEREIETHFFDEACSKETGNLSSEKNTQNTTWNCSPKSSNSEPNFKYNLNLTPKINESSLEERKKYLAEKLSNSGSPFLGRLDNGKTHLVRYGEFSPNNPQIRAATKLTAPYLGVGEYEQVKKALREQERADYLRHITEKSAKIKELSKIIDKNSKENVLSLKKNASKFVQTDIQDIRAELVQYNYRLRNPPEKELSPRSAIKESFNSPLVSPSISQFQAKEIFVGTTANKNRDKRHSRGAEKSPLPDYDETPTFMDGFSYSDPKDDLEKDRIKREEYQRGLRLQIEEKRKLQALKEEEERRQRENANRRLEEQLRHMQREKETEDIRNKRVDGVRRLGENFKVDLPVPRSHKRTESECTSTRGSQIRIDSNLNISKQQPNRNVPYSPRAGNETTPVQVPTPRLRSLSCTSVNSNSSRTPGGSVLAQLGNIRAQLLQEQRRMDETIRRQNNNRKRSEERE